MDFIALTLALFPEIPAQDAPPPPDQAAMAVPQVADPAVLDAVPSAWWGFADCSR
ncbi:hypothetical protein [Pseudorhodoferax sp. Leaf274]|uniref:hypothetical protein n=1 Tax=Pseudorhodoferax sp. Leaf274 TaxID=1736318 RepID=UPI0012E2F838|nr:hypothetical protein [Pseudorhodoferax sp. Leaf274]